MRKLFARVGKHDSCAHHHRGGVVGVVSIQSYTAGIYGEEDRDFLAEIATVAGPVLERCRAEDELRKLSLAVEQGPVMAMITDTKGKIEYVNPRFTEVSGWGFKEIVGENPRFLKSGEMPDDVYRNLWETISLGKVWRGELCNRAKSGALYWESASISPIRDAEGTITHYLGVMLDITEFKKAERRRDLGARLGYRLAGSHTIEQVANVVRETTEELWQWDSFALDVCSRGSLEMMTLVCVDTVDGVKREYEAVEHGLAQERRTSGFWKGEATLLNREQPDVGPKFVSFGESSRRSASLIHAPLLAGGEVVGVLTIQSYSPFMFDEGDRDLLAEIANLASPALERCRAEADNLRLAETIRQANDVVLIMGTDWRIKYVNPAFETSTGYTLAESLNRLPRELLDGGDHGDEFYREIEQLLESGRAWSGHLVSRHKDGSRIDEEATVSPIRDSSGRIINYIGVKRDVSREMLLQEELRQAQKMEAIGLLAGGVAHDFNNLLQIILGNSHLMQQQLQPGSAMASELDSVLRAAKRGASLTRQLLAFSRKQLLEPRVVNPNSAVANIESLIRRLIGEDVELHLVLDPRAGCILVDPGQLDSVLMNLSINARDAMQEGGVLTIRTANVDVSSGDAEKSPGMKPGNFVRITVTDTGCGMDEQTRQRVFEPFFTTKKSGEGTGLGLSMVYGIVKQSNGYVYVESRPGAGASFHVYLSRVSSPLVAEDRSGEEPAGEPGWETILVVEDDVDVRKLMCGFLRANGYTVLEARNGFDGLRAAEHHNGPIHLLLTDIVMPRMGGAELARQFRAIHPDTRVLYVSGYTDNAMVRQALADSGGAFVQKPVSPDVLSDKVRETLDS
jgi:PAS domain S-box-containing protein